MRSPLAHGHLLTSIATLWALCILGCGGDNATSPAPPHSWILNEIGYVQIYADLPALQTPSGLLVGGLGMHIISLATPSDPTSQSVGPQVQGTRYWDLRASAGGYIYASWHYQTNGALSIIHADMPFDNVAAELQVSLGSGDEPAIVRPGGILYALSPFADSLDRINLYNPLSPTAERVCPSYHAGRLRCFGDTLFLCCWDSGIYAIDLTQPDLNPGLYVDTEDEAVDLACAGAYVYIADRHDGVQIAPRTGAPTLVASIPSAHDSTEYVNVIEGKLYVSDGSLLQVFDLSNPTKPALIAQRVLAGPCYRVLQHGEYVLAFSRVPYSPTSTLGFHVLRLEQTQ